MSPGSPHLTGVVIGGTPQYQAKKDTEATAQGWRSSKTCLNPKEERAIAPSSRRRRGRSRTTIAKAPFSKQAARRPESSGKEVNF